ncbi:MAG: dTMP kinase [Chloroherpetonaceae bacterium]|nr:dTMP kinase [Chloroherpetonaceae bacterium]
MLISFEGLDASGKSTQLKLLESHLKSIGKDSLCLREPGGILLGEEIRNILLHHQEEIHPTAELLLFFASRAELIERRIRPALLRGEIVILDRFYDSTIAYQGFGRGIDLKIIEQLISIVTQGLEPNHTFYLDISPEAAFQRKTQLVESNQFANQDRGNQLDRMERSGLEFFRKVQEGYHYVAKKFHHRVVTLNAEENIESLHKKIVSQLFPNI